MIQEKRGNICLTMSKPIISNFDFGQPAESSGSQNNKKVDLPPDNLILVDAYWEKDGMKIRFIPHQMGNKLLKDNNNDNDNITLKVVFVFEYNNSTHNQEEAKFELSFKSPDTMYLKQEPKKITIKGLDILNNILKDNGLIVTNNDRICYFYEIKDFSSDLSGINQ